jgi:hypothetical protein
VIIVLIDSPFHAVILYQTISIASTVAKSHTVLLLSRASRHGIKDHPNPSKPVESINLGIKRQNRTPGIETKLKTHEDDEITQRPRTMKLAESLVTGKCTHVIKSG